MSLKSLRASLMDDVIGENTRREYIKDDLFTYNHRADRPLQRHELDRIADAVGVDAPESLGNKMDVRRAIAETCDLGTPGGTFSEPELALIAKSTSSDA